MAGMLPPFLPPSARQGQVDLPLITEFVVEQAEQSFGDEGATTALSSIETVDRAETLPLVTEFLAIESQSRPEASPHPPTEESASPSAHPLAAGGIPEHPAEQQAPEAAHPAQWMQQERDAFDWHGVATLASKQNEEQRAADEWASTNWDTSTLPTDHIAAVLLKLAKRVQKGELRVDADRGMSPEAILAAALSALLRSET